MRISKCFVCGNRCLGLKGQDTLCDTIFLQQGHEDKKVIKAKDFGECHLSCLIKSEWGAFWASRIMENLVQVRHYAVIAHSKTTTLLRSDKLRTTYLIRDDGWIADIHDKALQKSTIVNAGYLLPVKEVFYLPLSDMPPLIDEIKSAFQNRHHYYLRDLLNALALRPYLIYPIAIEKGLLRPLETEASQ